MDRKEEYEPILDQPNSDKLETDNTRHVEIDVNNRDMQQENANNYQSYQNTYTSPPPLERNASNNSNVEYEVLYPRNSSRPLSTVNYGYSQSIFIDKGFTVFFLSWFIPANILLLRIIFDVDLHYWTGQTILWRSLGELIGAIFFGLFWSVLWNVIILSNVYNVARNEQIATIVILTVSAISMTMAWVWDPLLPKYVWIFWFLCVLRIIWDKLVSGDENIYLTGSILQLLKPQLTGLMVSMCLLAFGTGLWLSVWCFSYSFASVAYYFNSVTGTTYGYLVPQAFLLLVMIWTIFVVRSLIQSIVASSIATWYKSQGVTRVSSLGLSYQSRLFYSFGSAVFASIFVDPFGILNWIVIRIHILIYGRRTNHSRLRTIADKIEYYVNSGSYVFMLSEQQDFVTASVNASSIFRKGINVAIQSTTMKYHCLFISLQAFAINLAGTGYWDSAFLTFLVTFCFTSHFHSACVSLLTCYGQDPSYLKQLDSSLDSQIQKKLQLVNNANNEDDDHSSSGDRDDEEFAASI